LSDWKDVNMVIEPGEPLNAIITDAGATNVLRFWFEIEDL